MSICTLIVLLSASLGAAGDGSNQPKSPPRDERAWAEAEKVMELLKESKSFRGRIKHLQEIVNPDEVGESDKPAKNPARMRVTLSVSTTSPATITAGDVPEMQCGYSIDVHPDAAGGSTVIGWNELLDPATLDRAKRDKAAFEEAMHRHLYLFTKAYNNPNGPLSQGAGFPAGTTDIPGEYLHLSFVAIFPNDGSEPRILEAKSIMFHVKPRRN